MPSQQEGWRGTRSWEGTQPGQLTQTGQRDIPYHVTSCPVYKLGGVGPGAGGNRCLGTNWTSVGKWWAIALCITCFVYSNPFIIIILILLLFCIYYYYFLPFCPINLYLHPRVLLFSWFSSPSHCGGGGSDQAAAWCLVVGWLKPWHWAPGF